MTAIPATPLSSGHSFKPVTDNQQLHPLSSTLSASNPANFKHSKRRFNPVLRRSFISMTNPIRQLFKPSRFNRILSNINTCSISQRCQNNLTKQNSLSKNQSAAIWSEENPRRTNQKILYRGNLVLNCTANTGYLENILIDIDRTDSVESYIQALKTEGYADLPLTPLAKQSLDNVNSIISARLKTRRVGHSVLGLHECMSKHCDTHIHISGIEERGPDHNAGRLKHIQL